MEIEHALGVAIPGITVIGKRRLEVFLGCGAIRKDRKGATGQYAYQLPDSEFARHGQHGRVDECVVLEEPAVLRSIGLHTSDQAGEMQDPARADLLENPPGHVELSQITVGAAEHHGLRIQFPNR